MYFVVMGQDAKGTSTRKMRAIAVDTLARILRVSILFTSGIFVSKNIEDFLII